MLRDSSSGHQQLLPPANWCPTFAFWTMQGHRQAEAAARLAAGAFPPQPGGALGPIFSNPSLLGHPRGSGVPRRVPPSCVQQPHSRAH